MKKRTKNSKHATWFKLLLTGLLSLLLLLVWVGSDKNAASDLLTMMPKQEAPSIQEDIGQIIAPLLKEDTFVLTFEDELPDPIYKVTEKEHRPVTFADDSQHQLALIIDDVGYSLKPLRRLLELPFTLTISILPDAPHAAEAARMAYQHGAKVMLHMPMQTSNPKYQQKMEKFYLHTGMNKQEFTQVFEQALEKIPHVEGINNHMGSLLTADKKSMSWLMELCQKHDLFFIDSRTSSQSVAAAVARSSGVSWNKRDIFLDHSVKEEDLQKAWDSALSCVKRNDHCVMLAHPHPETLDFLETKLLGLNHQDFVPITQLLRD
ncbi:MAG: divergent polysaccharide deacetylase family protein [Ghiorsea sp.]